MNDLNICGVLVMAHPDNQDKVGEALNRIPGVEVHAGDEHGRLVVTVEDNSSASCTEIISGMTDIEGVLSTSLVYHEIATDEAIEAIQEAAQ